MISAMSKNIMKEKRRPLSTQTVNDRHFPLEIAQFAFGEKVGEAIVVIRNRMGGLVEVIRTMEETKLHVFKILGGSTNSKNSESTYLIFFEAKKSNSSPDQLRKKLIALESVIHASVFGTEELVIDTTAIPLQQMGMRSVIMGDALIGEILRSVFKAGPHAIEAVRWGSIKAAIRTVNWINSINFLRVHSPQEQFSKVIELIQASGWGIFQTKFRKNGTPKFVTVRDSFEVNALRKVNDVPGCLLMNGYFSGLAGAIFGRPVRVEEKLCASRGQKYCKFYFED